MSWSSSMTRRWRDPVQRAQLSKAISDATKKCWADPDKRPRQVDPAIQELLKQHGISTPTFIALPLVERGTLVYRLRALKRSPWLHDTHMEIVNRILKESTK
jgi:hypothetical protein